jgi:hypothetical protein
MKEKLKDKYHDCGHRPRNTDRRKRTTTKNSVVHASKSLVGFVTAVESIPQKAKLTAEQIEASAWAAALVSPVTPDTVPPGWHTLAAIAVELGKAESTVGAQLRRAVRDGRAEMQKFRIATARGAYPVPHYRLK